MKFLILLFVLTSPIPVVQSAYAPRDDLWLMEDELDSRSWNYHGNDNDNNNGDHEDNNGIVHLQSRMNPARPVTEAAKEVAALALAGFTATYLISMGLKRLQIHNDQPETWGCDGTGRYYPGTRRCHNGLPDTVNNRAPGPHEKVRVVLYTFGSGEKILYCPLCGRCIPDESLRH